MVSPDSGGTPGWQIQDSQGHTEKPYLKKPKTPPQNPQKQNKQTPKQNKKNPKSKKPYSSGTMQKLNEL